MVDKPLNEHTVCGRQAGSGAAYFFLRGFAFFFTSSDRGFVGMASIRRASSSSDIGGSSVVLRGLFMVEVCGHG